MARAPLNFHHSQGRKPPLATSCDRMSAAERSRSEWRAVSLSPTNGCRSSRCANFTLQRHPKDKYVHPRWRLAMLVRRVAPRTRCTTNAEVGVGGDGSSPSPDSDYSLFILRSTHALTFIYFACSPNSARQSSIACILVLGPAWIAAIEKLSTAITASPEKIAHLTIWCIAATGHQ